MSNLKNKSDFSMISAELLIKEGYHASSVHCSYYGLFQKMKYTMKNHLNISYEQYNEDSKNSKTGSHVYLIRLICSEYSKIKSRKDAKNLERKILDLQEARHVADYDNVKITSDDSQNAYDRSINLLKEIKSTFKI